jgi:hypothetical protein
MTDIINASFNNNTVEQVATPVVNAVQSSDLGNIILNLPHYILYYLKLILTTFNGILIKMGLTGIILDVIYAVGAYFIIVWIFNKITSTFWLKFILATIVFLLLRGLS